LLTSRKAINPMTATMANIVIIRFMSVSKRKFYFELR
jgi:hypothetical protein